MKMDSRALWIPTLVVVLLFLLPLCLLLSLHHHAIPKARIPYQTDGDVLVSFAGTTTNPSGTPSALITITNRGTETLNYSYGVQILTDLGWAHTNGNLNQFQSFDDDDDTLLPNHQRECTVQPPAAEKWRVVVICRPAGGNQNQNTTTYASAIIGQPALPAR